MKKGWRTISVNAAAIVVATAGAILVYVGQIGLTPAQSGLVGLASTLAIAFANMYLRSITTTPIGQGDAETG